MEKIQNALSEIITLAELIKVKNEELLQKKTKIEKSLLGAILKKRQYLSMKKLSIELDDLACLEKELHKKIEEIKIMIELELIRILSSTASDFHVRYSTHLRRKFKHTGKFESIVLAMQEIMTRKIWRTLHNETNHPIMMQIQNKEIDTTQLIKKINPLLKIVSFKASVMNKEVYNIKNEELHMIKIELS